jgi:hypothetical protein
MQKPIRERLEEYLSGMDSASRREYESLLARDQSARQEIDEMRGQADLLQSLRAPEEELAPAPGFYARVMDRIESQRPLSVWEVFLQPVFARRLAYASLTLILVLGMLTVRAGLSPEVVASSPEAILAERPVSRDLGVDRQHDREVVLVDLVSYSY